jgi:hypothetical protein
MSPTRLSDLDPAGVLDDFWRRTQIPESILFGHVYNLRSEIDSRSHPGLVVFADSGLHDQVAIDFESGAVVMVGPNRHVRAVSPNSHEFLYLASGLNQLYVEAERPSKKIS